MSQAKKPYVITRLEVENFKRVKMVRVSPNGSVIQITGRNKQGKTSLLDAIEALLRGKVATPTMPIHAGKQAARNRLFLGNADTPRAFEISRKYSTDRDGRGVETLEILDAEHKPVKRAPQHTLDELFENGLAFEVSRFMSLSDAQQDTLLRQVAGIDFTELDAQYKAAYDERTIRNRELVALKARIAAHPRDFSAPEKEIASADILSQMDAAAERDAEIRNMKAEIADIEAGAARERERAQQLTEQIDKLQHELDATNESLNLRVLKVARRTADLERLEPVDLAPLRAQLASLEETNAKVRHNGELDKLETEHSAVEDLIVGLNDRIDLVKEEKEKQLAASSFPVKGLGFDDTGITLNGFPLKDASQREKLELCVAIACELEPQLLVFLVRDAVFDEQGVAELAEYAAARGAQVWLEMVREAPGAGTIYIEDGEVVDPPTVTA